eukprot:7108095-Ditylum_brightwellii.AAC.1
MVSHCPGPALEVTKPNTTSIMIKYKNTYTAHKTLGHRKSPAGFNALQKTVLADKANKYAVKASASSLTHSEGKLYYNSCYNRNMLKAIRDRPGELTGAAMTCLIDVQ